MLFPEPDGPIPQPCFVQAIQELDYLRPAQLSFLQKRLEVIFSFDYVLNAPRQTLSDGAFQVLEIELIAPLKSSRSAKKVNILLTGLTTFSRQHVTGNNGASRKSSV